MFTEEETFDRLRRPLLRDMLRLWRESPIPRWEDEEAFTFFKSYGWDKGEFGVEWNQYNGGRLSDD